MVDRRCRGDRRGGRGGRRHRARGLEGHAEVGQRQLVGAVGVIGPSRLNYARIIPMVDYTAKVIGRILG